MASKLWKKLNLKDQDKILVANSPDSFEPELAALTNVKVLKSFGKTKGGAIRVALRYQAGADR